MNQVYYPELDESVVSEVLPNGLPVVVVPRKGFSKAMAYFATNFGSIHQNFQLEGKSYASPAGVAHFLEHQLFDLPGRDVMGEFAALGASPNAFTSYDMTAYYFSCTQHFDECLKLLLEFVSTPYFSQESVAKEQGIIDQEIGMYQDSPDSVVFENLVQAMYHRHNIRLPILGTQQTIRDITPQILRDCHRAFYAPGNMLLCVVGDVDLERVVQLARQVLGDEALPVAQKESCQEPQTLVRPEVEQLSDVPMPMFNLGFKAAPTGLGQEAIRQEMVADLAAEALFGESSALYLQLYEQGLIDTSFGGGFETLDGGAMLLCSGDSRDPRAVRDAILARARELAAVPIPQADFAAIQRSALGRRIRGLDSFDSVCFRICAYHFSQFDYFRFPEVYRSIRPEDVSEFLGRVVRAENGCLSILNPKKEESL